MYGRVEVWLQSFLTSATDEREQRPSRPTPLSPEKVPPILVHYKKKTV
jgi:hypothetical protein